MHTLLRILTLLLLLITISMVSGIAQAASQMTADQTAATCCPAEVPTSDAPGNSPCSSPDCPCLACNSVETSSMFTLQITRSTRTFTYLSHQDAPATGHRRTIDYPPETISPDPAA